MKKIISVALVGVLSVCAIAVTANALHDPHGRWKHGAGWGHHGNGADDNGPLHQLLAAKAGRVMMLFGELNLTDEQKDQIHAVLESDQQAIVAVLRPLFDKHSTLHKAVAADKIDEQAIRTAATEFGAALGDVAVLAANIKERIRPILTEDQIKVLQDFHADHDRMIDAHLNRAGGKQD
ncbi:MAG: Spy/CpxP family protein refolding chaperone [Phycisphaerae bacterium]|nr:Spy/CpxP family protein refolding chaperone [Phycisphaerae bacterium]